jgi:hypothetical protein
MARCCMRPSLSLSLALSGALHAAVPAHKPRLATPPLDRAGHDRGDHARRPGHRHVDLPPRPCVPMTLVHPSERERLSTPLNPAQRCSLPFPCTTPTPPSDGHSVEHVADGRDPSLPGDTLAPPTPASLQTSAPRPGHAAPPHIMPIREPPRPHLVRACRWSPWARRLGYNGPDHLQNPPLATRHLNHSTYPSSTERARLLPGCSSRARRLRRYGEGNSQDPASLASPSLPRWSPPTPKPLHAGVGHAAALPGRSRPTPRTPW